MMGKAHANEYQNMALTNQNDKFASQTSDTTRSHSVSDITRSHAGYHMNCCAKSDSDTPPTNLLKATMNKLSLSIGTARTFWSGWSGCSRPTVESICSICSVDSVASDQLVSGSGRPLQPLNSSRAVDAVLPIEPCLPFYTFRPLFSLISLNARITIGCRDATITWNANATCFVVSIVLGRYNRERSHTTTQGRGI
jgi:hypothetical protein